MGSSSLVLNIDDVSKGNLGFFAAGGLILTSGRCFLAGFPVHLGSHGSNNLAMS